jgi:hypothetical protein
MQDHIENLKIIASKYKRQLTYILLIFLNIIIPWIVWENKNLSFLPYNIDNYRYIFSAALQSLAGIFAFIASSSLLMLQISGDNSPIGLRYFPKAMFVLLMIVLLLFIAADGLVIVTLQQSISDIHLFSINLVIIYNIISIAMVIIYVISAIRWLQPEMMLKVLLVNAKRTKDNNARLEILLSLEELTLKAIEKGYSNTVDKCIDMFENIAIIYIEEKPYLNIVEGEYPDPDHPLRVISFAITRVAKKLCRNGLDDIMYRFGSILARLSCKLESREEAKIYSVGISIAIRNINNECIEHNLDMTIYNFIGDLFGGIKDDEGMYPIMSEMEQLVKMVKCYKDKEFIIVAMLEGIIQIAPKHKRNIIHSVQKIISEIRSDKELIAKKGWFNNETIEELTEELEKILDIYPKNKKDNMIIKEKTQNR